MEETNELIVSAIKDHKGKQRTYFENTFILLKHTKLYPKVSGLSR